jgi:hypothetical protein
MTEMILASEFTSKLTYRGRRTDTVFELQFHLSQIDYFARRYSDDDSKALQAGKEIAAGHYSSEHLRIIHGWKTRGRRKSLLMRNSSEEKKSRTPFA